MLFSSSTIILNEGHAHKIQLLGNGEPLSGSDVLNLWQTNSSFVSYFTHLLASAPFQAFFWEMPPLIRANVGQPFEFVLVESPQLAQVKSDSGAFDGYFSSAENEAVVAFDNLGQDAFLIAPCPCGPVDTHTHLAIFSRKAPASQQQAFWQRVGREVMERLSDHPMWVSTSGLGVYWLHVRLDISPKYYTWQPYTVI